ncbi:CynX/NimT family MFS transporter [Altererythrobacter fulvus]|uniref:MFS transporter n=1 Tax=Caenibius fulvus TaxID=2126012 RepID=UPI0030158F70
MTFDGRLKYLVLGALALLFFILNACTFNGLGVVLPYMVEELGWSWATAGVGFTLLGIACGLSGLIPALLIRKFGVSRTMLTGGTVLFSGFACLALTYNPFVYFLGTILLGIGFAICGQVPAVNVISHSFKKHSTAMGFYFTVGGLGSVAGPLIAYATQEITNEWRLFWGGAAIAALLLSMFTSAVTATRWNNKDAGTKAKASDATVGWSVRAAMRTPQYYVIVGAYTSLLLISTTVHGFAVQHLSDSGLGMGGAATVMSALALISAGASAVAGVAGEKMKPRALSMLSLATAIIGVVALMGGSSPVAIGIATLGLGVGIGFSYVSVAMLLLDVFGKRPNLELYSTMSLISTSAAIGPALGGFARDQLGSFSLVFLVCGLIGTAFFMALLLFKRPSAPGDAEETEAVLAPAC